MIIGIDLGTTNSLAAYYKDGKAVIIPNRLGKHLTPSIVCEDEEGKISVGETAREYGYLNPLRVASVFKRTMGTDKKYRLGDHYYTSKELSAFVLRSLKEDAEAYLGETVTEAVISVPAYFDETRRKATRQAGELAGLKVERIISEPTAAAIAYGLNEKEKNTRFLVFDLGGGTFDVSVLNLLGNILEVRSVAGDNLLGGEDFTKKLENALLEKHALDRDDLSEKEQLRLRKVAEEAKLAFSNGEEVDFTYIREGKEYSCHMDSTTYEFLCEELFGRMKKAVQRSIKDAHLKLSDIDEVVLVGGATKLPIVRSFIARLFKKFPNTTVNPDEAVALGAAMQAAIKDRDQSIKEVILTDVCSFTLGTEVSVQRPDGTFESGHYLPIIDRNTVIPASRTETVYTLYDNQEHICVRVLQGESRFASNNLLIGMMEIKVPKNKAGAESVDITYTYDINALLEVQIKINSTGEIQKKVIKGNENDMTPEQIEERMQQLAYLKVHPRDQEENRLLLIKGERLYEECSGDMRDTLDAWLREFEAALDDRSRKNIESERKILRDRLKWLEEDF